MATSPEHADPPLSLEPVLGWRVWRLERREGVLKLVSVTRPDAWPPGKAMRANCPRHLGVPTPSTACTCGLYAASSPENLARAGISNPATCVVGAIAMWGTVVEHTKGARSSLAYPARLRLVCGKCLADGRGGIDPVVVVKVGEALVALCEEHRAHVPGRWSPAEEIRSELLATYGVEEMPIERVDRSMRSRRAAPAPVDPLKTAARVVFSLVKAVALGLFWLWALSGFIFVGAWLLFSVVNFILHGPDRPPAPAAWPSVTQTHMIVPPKHDLPHRGTRPPPIPAFATVCGVGAGDHVEIVPCAGPSSDLLGFAERTEPNGPKTDCTFGWDAYTRGPHYSICWATFGLDVFVHRWASAPSPWSISVREGGAR